MTKTESIAVIIETVCLHYSVSYDQLKSKSRKAPLPECRAVVWTIIRKRFFKQTSYKYLGSLFGCCKRSSQKGIERMDTLVWNKDVPQLLSLAQLQFEINAKLNK